MERNMMSVSRQDERDEPSAEQIRLEALASKHRVRASVENALISRSILRQMEWDSSLEQPVDADLLFELA